MALQQGLPVLTRPDLWRTFSRQREVVAVSGTHGKTTISSLLAHLYRHAGKPHGHLLGAPLGEEPAGRWGSGDLIVEADEYDRTFLALSPRVAIISNVDYDHVDIYPDQADYDAAFQTFAQSTLENGGQVIACGDDPGVRRILERGSSLSYGLGDSNDWQAINLRAGTPGMTFTLLVGGQDAGEVFLPLPGEHNVLNALAALSASTRRGVPLHEAVQALTSFPGVPRRLERRGEAGGVQVYDDYAHHPTEVRAVLGALRGQFPARRLIAAFQPHTYSRWRAFEPEFRRALAEADLYRVLPVYGAREGGAKTAPADLSVLACVLRPGDVVVILSAGDGQQLSAELLMQCQTQDGKYPPK